ncbi:hypothetical protein CERSUDRAFT_78616 [Gelatoporia subvermispora B]|uniref:Uncharacterized protein n=1 Tax=Ceriporiopsis subvermispora (strain B) TaxID=914234 RepID=M2Q1U9_CERS8|nr:hypothetical protein CERSUDRAFT_78616 [Gelatoporia subvermispora B]
MTWATGEKLQLLNQHMPEFLSHKASGTTGLFWNFINDQWRAQWPDPAGPQGEEAKESRMKQIRMWYHNHSRPQSGNGQQSLLNLGRKPHTRKPHSWQVYMKLYWDDLRTLDLNSEITQQRAYKNSHKFKWTQAQYEKVKHDPAVMEAIQRSLAARANGTSVENLEDTEVVEEVMTEQAQAEAARVQKAKMLQKSIDKVAPTIKQALKEILKDTGMIGMIMVGGPVPITGGKINLFRACTATDGESNFFKFLSNVNDDLLIPFCTFLDRSYPQSARDSIAFPVNQQIPIQEYMQLLEGQSQSRSKHEASSASKVPGPLGTSSATGNVNLHAKVTGSAKTSSTITFDGHNLRAIANATADGLNTNANSEVLPPPDVVLVNLTADAEVTAISDVEHSPQARRTTSCPRASSDASTVSLETQHDLNIARNLDMMKLVDMEFPSIPMPSNFSNPTPAKPHLQLPAASSQFTRCSARLSTAAQHVESPADKDPAISSSGNPPAVAEVDDVAPQPQDGSQGHKETSSTHSAAPSAAASSIRPAWLIDTEKHFRDLPNPPRLWSSLVDALLQFELTRGLPNEKARYQQVHYKARPEAVGIWIKNDRKWDFVPADTQSSDYSQHVVQWWRSLQPPFRHGDWPHFRIHYTGETDWGVLLQGGTNGIFLVVLAFWWLSRKASTDTAVLDLNDLIADVTWVLREMTDDLNGGHVASGSLSKKGKRKAGQEGITENTDKAGCKRGERGMQERGHAVASERTQRERRGARTEERGRSAGVWSIGPSMQHVTYVARAESGKVCEKDENAEATVPLSTAGYTLPRY